ncbi:MAG: M48 family metallopeptidase [Alphaproteobacteria bacterium]|nr:M48 family metallopeptidase [Alphaproteobacteria bacterium]
MGKPAIGLSSHIWNNNARCILLLALYPVLVAVIFWVIAFLLGLGSTKGMLPGAEVDTLGVAQGALNLTLEFLPLILTVVAIWFIIAWFSHSLMIRKLSHSHPVARSEEPELYNLLENLCISRGIKIPHLEIIETHARNAFASGIDEKSYSITVTRGLMNSLAKDELEGVLAHELTHILNRDVRLLIVCVIFTGMFGFLAQLAWSNIRYSLFYSRQRRDNSMATVFAMLIIAVVLWLGYMATLLMRFALSRHREYMADAGAVEMTKNPDGMMRALMRISGRDRIPETTDDIAMMCIENHVPFLGVFATHPPIEQRIIALSEVTNTPIPDSLSLPPVAKEERISRNKNHDRERVNPWLTRGRRP